MKILSLGLDRELSLLRNAVIAADGHDVTSLTSEKEALQAAQSPNGYDVVLLSHDFPTAAARQTIRLIRQSQSGARIVYIVHVYGEWPEVEADRYVVGADGPDALLRVLREIQT